MKNEWISIHDRLPDVFERVLISVDRITREAIYNGCVHKSKTPIFSVCGDSKVYTEVALWLPMPDAPK